MTMKKIRSLIVQVVLYPFYVYLASKKDIFQNLLSPKVFKNQPPLCYYCFFQVISSLTLAPALQSTPVGFVTKPANGPPRASDATLARSIITKTVC